LPADLSPELTGPGRTLEEIRTFLDADSVGYLSLNGLRTAVNDTSGSFCSSCFTGVYLPENIQLEVSVPAAVAQQSQGAKEDAGPYEP
jgi:amidophosphoribosyltransferase